MNIYDNGEIKAEGYGTGITGDIKINSLNQLDIVNGLISTHSIESDGGNIDIQTGKQITMKDSQVTTSVEDKIGNGGNISINSPYSILNNSQIIANAYEGNGGNISISSEQLIKSSNSNIDASSKLGINGNVNILSPEADFSSDLNILPSNFIDASHWLNTPCELRGDDISSLIINERDSLPQTPDDLLVISPFLLFPKISLVQKIKPLILNGLQKNAIAAIKSIMIDRELSHDDIHDDIHDGICTNILLANIYMELGFKNKALLILNQIAKNVIKSSDRIDLQSIFYLTRGDLALSMGKLLSRAESDIKKGMKLAKLTKNSQLIAASLNHLANYYAAAGLTDNNYDFAWNHYMNAIEYLQDNDSNNNSIIRAVILINQAHISLYKYSSFDSYKIEKSIEQAIHAVQQLDNHWFKGFYLLALYKQIHNYIESYPDKTDHLLIQNQTIINLLFSVADEMDNPQLLSYANGYYGHYLACQNINKPAVHYTKKAIFISQQNNLPEITYLWKWQLAKLLTNEGDFERSQKVYESAIESVRPISNQFFYAGRFKPNVFKESIQPIYMELINLKINAVKSGSEDITGILEIIEKAKIAELQNFYKDECIDKNNDTKNILTYLKELHLRDHQDKTVIIYPLLTDPLMMIALFEDGPKLISTQTNLTQLKNNALRFHERLNQGRKESRIKFLGNQIYQSLIQPLQPYLEDNINTLVFVPDGELRMIPYAALYNTETQKYLCETYAVVTLPALTLTQKQLNLSYSD